MLAIILSAAGALCLLGWMLCFVGADADKANEELARKIGELDPRQGSLAGKVR